MCKKTNEIDLWEKRFARLLADTSLLLTNGNFTEAHRLVDAEIDAVEKGAISFTWHRAVRSNMAKMKKNGGRKTWEKSKKRRLKSSLKFQR